MQFCHGGEQTGCAIGRRDPVDTFELINNWIDENENNVIMIWLQINEAAGGPISLEDVDGIVQKVPIGPSGRSFASRLYRRDRYSENPWPSLSEMIAAEQQVLFFYMGGPDGSENHPDGIHYFYEYGMTNHWSYASVSELQDTMINDCPIHRSSSNRHDFLMLNNFVTAKVFGIQVKPSRNAAEEINTAIFLEPILDVCESETGQKVNIVSVDFWKSGDLTSFVNEQNLQLVSQNATDMVPQSDPSSVLATLTQTSTGTAYSRGGKGRVVDRVKDMGYGG
ncbi:MAG: hypothetical protein SGILL_003995 [Bacillariaceae sp.]